METELVTQNTALIEIGTLPMTANEVFTYVKDLLVLRGTPLKEKSIALHSKFTLLPGDWSLWTDEEIALASSLYDEIGEHQNAITTAKGTTELDIIKGKAFKLHRGITAAVEDILADTIADKEALMKSIRAWRKRETDRAEKEAEEARLKAEKDAEDQRLAEALQLEQEAERLKGMGQGAIAEEVKAEADKVLSEHTYVPLPPVRANIPTGGPKKQTFYKFNEEELNNVNSPAFKMLPDAFKLPNLKMIRATVNAQKMATKIAGVKVVAV